ncbi:MAG TPA: toll/interleukin-1 receptor domain-containing protein [Bryobacteraceae bacterium]
MARDVFISYRSEDKESAERLCAALERQNISSWIAPRDIPAGNEWATAIVEGLQRSHCFVLLLSSNSQNARQISREAELADHQGLPIITFRIEDVQPPPGLLYFLGNVQWLDAFAGQFDAAVARLADVIRQNTSYPAEKTTVRKAPSLANPPVVPPPTQPTNAAPSATAGPTPMLLSTTTVAIAVAAVVFLAVLGWLLLRHPRDHSRHGGSPETEVVAAAQRFIQSRDSGDLAAAWQQFTPESQARISEQRWSANVREAIKKNGEIRTHNLKGCTPNADSTVYTCYFTLVYQSNLSAQNKIILAKRGDGSWGIAGTERSAPR